MFAQARKHTGTNLVGETFTELCSTDTLFGVTDLDHHRQINLRYVLETPERATHIGQSLFTEATCLLDQSVSQTTSVWLSSH